MGRERRRQPRYRCRLDARLLGREGPIPVVVTDLSVGGLRMQLEPGVLGLDEDATVPQIARRLGALLPEAMPIELPGPEGAGPVQAEVVAVHMARFRLRDGTCAFAGRFARPPDGIAALLPPPAPEDDDR